LNGVQEVGGSNPLAPTTKDTTEKSSRLFEHAGAF
jgi:hypothetical protein